MSIDRENEQMSRAEHRDRFRVVRPAHVGRRAGAAVLAALTLALIGAGDRLPGAVEGREFVLRDGDGLMRASLTIRPNGTPGLGLFDKSGQVRLSLDLAEDAAPGVNLFDADGTLRAAIAIRPDGTPAVGLFDERGQVQRSVEIEANGQNGAGETIKGRTPPSQTWRRPDTDLTRIDPARPQRLSDRPTTRRPESLMALSTLALGAALFALFFALVAACDRL
jgi:hypothetical protein